MQADFNVAYSEEYRQARAAYDWLFASEPEKETVVIEGSDRYQVTCFSYSEMHPRPDGIIARYDVKKILIADKKKNDPVFEYEIIDDRLLLKIIRHRNGRDYLLFNIDLYGYSVLDLKTREAIHYVPEESFRGGETFLWMDALYCPENDLLAIEGCYWACPWSIRFYDFANPMQLPFPLYCDSFALEDDFGVDIDIDVRAVRFTDTGECVIRCWDERGNMADKIIDVIKFRKNVSL